CHGRGFLYEEPPKLPTGQTSRRTSLVPVFERIRIDEENGQDCPTCEGKGKFDCRVCGGSGEEHRKNDRYQSGS
ncbi:MAG: hypothetical protein ACR2IV_17500, partial [Bryobacteraceae bacterium]